MQSTSTGKYHQQRQAIASLFIRIATADYQLLKNESVALANQISQLDSISLLEQEEPLIEQLREVVSNIHKVENEALQKIIADIEQIVLNNQVLDEYEAFEVNEKAINQIILNTAAKGVYEFNDEQMNLIDVIAEQCPLSDGIAVHMARGLQAIYKPQFYDDQNICQPATERQNITSNDKAAFIKLYPNPAKHILNIQIEEQGRQNLAVEIWTVEGKRHQQLALKNSADISVKDWPVGIYLVLIRDQQEAIIYQEKVIIAK